LKTVVGTTSYKAPEMIRGESYDFSVDTYAFGMLLYEMITGKMPFDGLAEGQVIKEVLANKRPTIPQNCIKELKELIDRCWDGIKESRPKFEEISESLKKIIQTTG